MTRLVSRITKTALCVVASYQHSPMLSSKIFTRYPERLVHGVEIFKSLYNDDEEMNRIQQSREAQRRFYSVKHAR